MNFFKALNIETSERVSVSLLIVQSIFLGFYLGAMDIVSHALFLEAFDQKTISTAYIVSGVVGIVLTTIYSYAQNKIRFSRFSIYNLALVALLTVLIRLGFEFISHKEIIFILFVLFYPLYILAAILGFWGTVARIFNLRQGKRLFGLIDSGLIIGAIICSFSIPFILTTGFSTINLLYISIVGVSIAFILQFFISNKYLKGESNVGENKDLKREEKINFLKLLYSNTFVRLMSLFILLSVITGFFIQYLFLGVIKEKYPDEKTFAQFFGAFMAVIMTVSIIVKTTVYSKLLKTYGLKVSLLISPVILIMFTVLAALAGSFFGYSGQAAGFIFFFLAIALSKLLSKTLKDSIETPAFKLLYQSLNPNMRYGVQARIDGTVNEISALTSGICLLAFGLVSFVQLIHYSYALIIIVLGWFYVARLLYREYKSNLTVSLATSVKTDSDLSKQADLFSWFKTQYHQFSSHQKAFGIKILSRINPLSNKELLKLISAEDINNKENNENETNEELKPLLENITKQLSQEAFENAKSDNVVYDNEKVISQAKSSRVEDRKNIASLLADSQITNDDALLILLKDYNAEIKNKAILASSKSANSAVIQLLVDNLFLKEHFIASFYALKNVGSLCIKHLELAFNRTEISLVTQLRIVRLYADINCEESTQALQKLLSHNNKQIFSLAVKSLYQRDYTIPADDRYQFNQLIIKHIEIISWNINALSNLSYVQDEELLKLINSIRQEQVENYELLYNLLSLVYDSKSVNRVRQYLDEGTSESISFALELLDLFIDEELKPFLIPLFEDISDNDKIRLLQNEFPLMKYTLEEQLEKIINRDYQKTSIWSKACAISCINILEGNKLTETLISNIFNPNTIIQELSFTKLSTLLEKSEFDALLKRKAIVERNTSRNISNMYNATLFLKRIKTFENLPEIILLKVAEKLTFVLFEKDTELKNTELLNVNYIFIETGEAILRSNQKILKYYKNGIIDFTFFNTNNVIIEVERGTQIYTILRDEVEELSFDYSQFGRSIIASPKETKIIEPV